MKKVLIFLLAAAVPFWMIACAAPAPEPQYAEPSSPSSSQVDQNSDGAPSQSSEASSDAEPISSSEPEDSRAASSEEVSSQTAPTSQASQRTASSEAPRREPAASSSSKAAPSSKPRPLPSSPAPAPSQSPPVSTPSSSPPVSQTPPANDGSFVSRVGELVNAERQKYGLPAIVLNQELCANAQVRAAEIVQKFDHTRPNGESFGTAITIEKWAWGENIAWGQQTPEAVMDAWMNSPGHRANILHENFTKIGVGVTENAGRLYWVQLFVG